MIVTKILRAKQLHVSLCRLLNTHIFILADYHNSCHTTILLLFARNSLQLCKVSLRSYLNWRPLIHKSRASVPSLINSS